MDVLINQAFLHFDQRVSLLDPGLLRGESHERYSHFEPFASMGMGRRITERSLGIIYLPGVRDGLVHFVKMKICNLPKASCKGHADKTNI